MSHRFLPLCFMLICLTVAAAPGEKLLAEWDFSKRTDADLAGKFTGGFCRGTATITDGWLGNPQPYSDKPSGYQVGKTIYPELTPSGGFRIEVICKLNPTPHGKDSIVFDNKYLFYNPGNDTHHGLAFGLTRRKTAPEKVAFIAYMGFADHSVNLTSKFFPFNLDEEHLFAMEFNGNGRVVFSMDGTAVATHYVDGKSLAPALRPLTIGDRYGSMHDWLDGKMRSLKIYTFAPQLLVIKSTGRKAFRRGEQNATLKFTLLNSGETEIGDIKLEYSFGDVWKELKGQSNTLQGGQTSLYSLPVDTLLRVGDYPLKLRASGNSDNGLMVDQFDMTLSLGPLLPPDDYPVVMWGDGDIDTMKSIGFTHDLGGFSMGVFLSKNLDETAAKITNNLDTYIRKGFRRADQFSLSHTKYLKQLHERFPRISKEGVRDEKTIEASNPEYQQIVSDVAAKTAQIVADNIACDALLINSEVRDRTFPSFGDVEPAAFEKFSGYPIPKGVITKYCPPYRRLSDFPFSHIVKEDNPYFTYYNWFWKVGDGWNVVNSIVSEQYHKYIHRPFWTFHDPAARTPPVWGSGGSVDYLSHWTYAYPDPIRVAATTDELFMMSEGRPGQKVMVMTQLICFRRDTSPIGTHPENEPSWVKDSPEGPYITIPPDALREAIWSMISRKVDGIMFHGNNSLWGKPGNTGYVTTNKDTLPRLTKMLHEIVTPLGPTLKRIPDRPPKVAILQSFASSLFAQRGTWSNYTWLYNSHLMLQWANLSPSIIYEEKIARDGFGDIKVLCMFHCDVLTENTFNAILKFQKQGGIIVADEFLLPGIVPDINIKSVTYPKQAKDGKAALQAVSAELRNKLNGYYTPYSDADNMDIITRVRSYRNADYLFVLNDKRDYGDYLGPWEMTMEKGLPNAGTVTLRRKAQTAAVYDLVAHKKVEFKATNDGILLPQTFDSNDGRLLLAIDKEIADVKIQTKTNGKVKSELSVTATVLDKNAKPIEALIPIDIAITSPDGRILDGSGPACAINGIFTHSFLPDDAPGKWQITVTELASGKNTTKIIALNGEMPK